MKKAIVRILDGNDNPVGTGFLAAKDVVVTCAHVVGDALEGDKWLEERPSRPVSLDFPFLDDCPRIQASVRRWYPANPGTELGKPEDIAILEPLLETPVPDAARPVSGISLDDGKYTGRKVRMYGFPPNHNAGVWSKGELVDETTSGWIQIAHQKGENCVAPGFSGAAVFDGRRKKCLGMLVSEYELKGVETSYMIPYETIRSVSPGLGKKPKRKIGRTPALAAAALLFLLAAFLFVDPFSLFERPRFGVDPPVTKPDGNIVIKALNDIADQNRHLDIEFDDLMFHQKGLPLKKVENQPQTWRFSMSDNLPQSLLQKNYYYLRAAFSGECFHPDNKIKIAVVSDPLLVGAKSIPLEDSENKRMIRGIAGSESQIPENRIDIEIVTMREGREKRRPVPVVPKTDKKTGLSYYAFETVIESEPAISPQDPRYRQPFFKIIVKDRAGNVFDHEQTYEEFKTGQEEFFGVDDFGASPLAAISMDSPMDDEVAPVNPVEDQIVKQLADGKPPVILTVSSVGENKRRLEWKVRVSQTHPVFVVFRNNVEIKRTGTASFTDSEIIEMEKAEYKVEFVGPDGRRYVSNPVLWKPAENRKNSSDADGAAEGQDVLDRGIGDRERIAVELPTAPQTVFVEKEESLEGESSLEKKGTSQPDFTNSIGMEFVYIEPEEFMMGSPENEPGHYWDETLHNVKLTHGFFMQTMEVTQGQWKAIMGNNPSYFQECGDDCPVENVSWNNVQDFIEKLNRLEGKEAYRLPTEAEWEYVCRAGTTTAFANGELTNEICSDPNLDKIGWYCGNADEKTHPVARKDANKWNIHDMHGNVWEWCQDWYGEYDPENAVNPEGPADGTSRVVRGGGWGDHARDCRSANRAGLTPGYRYQILGFRLLRSAP